MTKMVIVDDHLETAQSLSLLYRIHHSTEIIGLAQDSERLWKIVSDNEVDFVSLDIQLGHENGIDICRELHQKHPDIFIVVCSVEATLENRRLAIEAGASHFLAKPVTINEAIKTIEKFSTDHKDLDAKSSPLTVQEMHKLFTDFS